MGDQTSVSETSDSTELGDVEVFRELERELRDANDWEGVVELYDDHLDDLADEGVDYDRMSELLESLAERVEEDTQVSQIHTILGDIYADNLYDFHAAKQAYRSAFVADTDNTASLEKARRLYRQEGNHELVLKLYELEQQVADTDREKADVLVRKAHVHGDRLDNMDVAIELVRDALALVEDHPLAEITEDLYESGTTTGEGLREAVELAKDAIREDEPSIAAEFLLTGARLELGRDGGFPERGKVLVRRAAETAPNNAEVVDLFEEVFDESPPDESAELDAAADGGDVSLSS